MSERRATICRPSRSVWTRLGHEVFWWENPAPSCAGKPGEDAVQLPGGFRAPASQVGVRPQRTLTCATDTRVPYRSTIDRAPPAGRHSTGKPSAAVPGTVPPHRVYRSTGSAAGVELLIAEMLAIHYCSDQSECRGRTRTAPGRGPAAGGRRRGLVDADAVRVFWLNPGGRSAHDESGGGRRGRICGTEYLFSHAVDVIPEDVPPLEALARMALADPMVGSPADRADRVCRDMVAWAPRR